MEYDRLLMRIDSVSEKVCSVSGGLDSVIKSAESNSTKINDLTMKVVIISATLKPKDVIDDLVKR